MVAVVVFFVLLWLVSPRHQIPLLHYFVSAHAHQQMGGQFLSVGGISLQRLKHDAWRVRVWDVHWLDDYGQRLIHLPQLDVIVRDDLTPQRIELAHDDVTVIFSSQSSEASTYVPRDITQSLLILRAAPVSLIVDDTVFHIEDIHEKQRWRLDVRQAHIRAGGVSRDVRGFADVVVADDAQPFVKAEITLQLNLNQDDKGQQLDGWITAPTIAMRHATQLWPRAAETDLRQWIAENMNQGSLRQVHSHFSVRLQNTGETFVQQLQGAMQLSQVSLTYVEGLPVIEGIDGEARFDRSQMEIVINRGQAGMDAHRPVHISHGRVVLNQLDSYRERARGDVRVRCELRSCLWFLDHEPIGLGEIAHDVRPESRGQMQAQLSFDMDLRTVEELNDSGLRVRGDITDLFLPSLVFEEAVVVPLVGLDVNTRVAQLTGDGTLGDVDTSFFAFISFDDAPSQYGIQGVLSHDQRKKTPYLSSVLAALPHGALPYRIAIAEQDDDIITVDVDMSELVSHPLSLSATITGDEWRGIRFNQLAVRGDAIEVTGHGQLMGETGMVSLNTVRFFNSEGQVSFNWAGNIIRARLHMDSLISEDVRQLLEATSGLRAVHGSQLKMIVTFDIPSVRSQRYENRVIDSLRGWTIVSNGIMQDFSMEGRLGQGERLGQVTMRVFREKATRQLHLDTDQAGTLFAALGMTGRLQQGNLTARISSPLQETQWTGSVLMENFTWRHPPQFMELLYQLSLGEQKEVAADSSQVAVESDLPFASLRVALRGDGSSVVTLDEGRVETDGFALSFEGQLDYVRDRMAFGGTLTPYQNVNEFLSHVPLLGDLLLGGSDEGLFALRYGLSGRLSDPDVEINPLSVLFPGALRYVADGLSFLWGGVGQTRLEEVTESPP